MGILLGFAWGIFLFALLLVLFVSVPVALTILVTMAIRHFTRVDEAVSHWTYQELRSLLRERWVRSTVVSIAAGAAPFIAYSVDDFWTGLATGALSVAVMLQYGSQHRPWLSRTDSFWGLKVAHAFFIALAIGFGLLALKFGQMFWDSIPQTGPKHKMALLVLVLGISLFLAWVFQLQAYKAGKWAIGGTVFAMLALTVALLSGWDMSSLDAMTQSAKALSKSPLFILVSVILMAILLVGSLYWLGFGVKMVAAAALVVGLVFFWWHFDVSSMLKDAAQQINSTPSASATTSSNAVVQNQKKTGEKPTVQKWVGRPQHRFSANYDDLSEAQQKAERDTWPSVTFHNSTARETELVRLTKSSDSEYDEVALWNAEDVIMRCFYDNGKAPESFRWVGGRICTRDNMYAFTLISTRDDEHAVLYAFRKKAASPNS